MTTLKELIGGVIVSGPGGGISSGKRGTVGGFTSDGRCVVSIGGKSQNIRMGTELGNVIPGKRVLVQSFGGASYVTGILQTFEPTKIRKVIIDA